MPGARPCLRLPPFGPEAFLSFFSLSYFSLFCASRAALVLLRQRESRVSNETAPLCVPRRLGPARPGRRVSLTRSASISLSSSRRALARSGLLLAAPLGSPRPELCASAGTATLDTECGAWPQAGRPSRPSANGRPRCRYEYESGGACFGGPGPGRSHCRCTLTASSASHRIGT